MASAQEHAKVGQGATARVIQTPSSQLEIKKDQDHLTLREHSRQHEDGLLQVENQSHRL